MDDRSLKLMEDFSFEGVGAPKSNVSYNRGCPNSNGKVTQVRSKLKVEMQTLRVSDESEKQLYDTLKHIYGPSFKLADASEFEDKKSNLGKQYWLERGNLVIKGIVDYSSKEVTPKSHDQITRQFATAKLESYNFHSSHCTEALMYTKGDLGKALEILFQKYYDVSPLETDSLKDFNVKELLEKRQEEKEALESIYGDTFFEKIKNNIWIVRLKLNYLVNKKEDSQTIVKPRKQEREICRLFVHKKCRFGAKCRFLHQQPERPETRIKLEDSYFTLEIRFPEGCQYPHEPPFFYFYKDGGMYSKINSLRIARKLYNEAALFAAEGTPSIFSIISLLENEYDITIYLKENKEQFLDQNEPLFPVLHDREENLNAATHYQKGSVGRSKRNHMSQEEIIKDDDEIQKKYKEKQASIRYKKMRETRRKLPAWSKMDEILELVQQARVIIISGETGCGKSTQIPQFILDNWIMNRSENKEHVNIVCTQPRRISAIGVAERVAVERDEYVGNTIGYQIRLESKISNKTRLTFCTIGILLQRFSADPELSNITHVIVDEVHERSAESDFLLMLLKQLLPKRPELKIILMSATLKADVFSAYFGETPVLCIPGKTFPVEQVFLEDILERTNYVLEENAKYTRKTKINFNQLQIDLETVDMYNVAGSTPKESIPDENLTLLQLVNRYQGYSKQTYKNLYVMDHHKINYELIEKIVEWIVAGEHEYPRTGSILIFLPGFLEIVTLRDQLNENKNLSSASGKFIIIPLHSSLSGEEQNLVFKKTPSNVRKIILSTNIAETSITVDDCVFVIDTGKMKETRFNANQNMESLETCWVTRANVLQRKGRAGRVMPGVSIHLYTSYRYKYHFDAQPIPEILRIPLEPIVLRIKLTYKPTTDVHKILNKLLDAPTKGDISCAMERLQDVGALDSEYALTPLGHHLAALPVNVRIGKLLLFGAVFCCLDSALTIAACLSHKNPFSIPFENRQKLNVKKDFFTANSDQLTTLKAYKKWLEACSRSTYAGQVFANENYLSIRTLHTLADIKHQFLELLVFIGFVPINLPKRKMGVDNVSQITGFELNVNNENYKLLQGLLCAALYPNVAKVFTPEKSFQVQSAGAVPIQPKPEDLRFQTKHDNFVSIHPSSVNFSIGHFSSPYLVFQEKIKTSKLFIKEVSMVPVLPLILFSSYELKIELHNGTFILSLDDGWIVFSIESHRVGQLIQLIRVELTKLLQQKMQDPLLNLLNHQQGKKIIHTIVSIVTRE